MVQQVIHPSHPRWRLLLGRRPHEGWTLRHFGQRCLCGGERVLETLAGGCWSFWIYWYTNICIYIYIYLYIIYIYVYIYIYLYIIYIYVYIYIFIHNIYICIYIYRYIENHQKLLGPFRSVESPAWGPKLRGECCSQSLHHHPKDWSSYVLSTLNLKCWQRHFTS